MKVRAKFLVSRVEHVPTSMPEDVCANVYLQAVYDNGKANKEWSKHTPAGNIIMTITNPSAIDAFNAGEEYFVDFIPAKKAE